MTRLSSCLALVLIAPTLVACGASRGGLSADTSSYGSPTSEAAVRAFLAAADRQDYEEMGRQFGTAAGPAEARLGIAEVEQRMVVLAEVLQHGSMEMERSDLAQLGSDRARYVVRMTGTRNGEVDVPVVTAVTDEGRWFVERLDVEALSGPGGS
ncbi:MAG: hypothetical protein ACOC83_01175 [Gemmatimonadota bacterium]